MQKKALLWKPIVFDSFDSEPFGSHVNCSGEGTSTIGAAGEVMSRKPSRRYWTKNGRGDRFVGLGGSGGCWIWQATTLLKTWKIDYIVYPLQDGDLPMNYEVGSCRVTSSTLSAPRAENLGSMGIEFAPEVDWNPWKCMERSNGWNLLTTSYTLKMGN